jgi:hypothetical protein
MQTDNIKITHYVYIWRNYGPPRRNGQRAGWWQREGIQWSKPNGESSVFLHSTPIGGFDGRIRLVEIDKPQPAPPNWLEVAQALAASDQPEGSGDEKPATVPG